MSNETIYSLRNKKPICTCIIWNVGFVNSLNLQRPTSPYSLCGKKWSILCRCSLASPPFILVCHFLWRRMKMRCTMNNEQYLLKYWVTGKLSIVQRVRVRFQQTRISGSSVISRKTKHIDGRSLWLIFCSIEIIFQFLAVPCTVNRIDSNNAGVLFFKLRLRIRKVSPHLVWLSWCIHNPGTAGCMLELQMKVHLLALSHLRHYAKLVLTHDK